MKNFLPCLLLLFIFFSACKKNTVNDFDLKTPGTVSGVFRPALEAATGVTATTIIDGQPVSFYPSAVVGGNFNFTDLPAGEYTLSFTADPRYIAPENKTIKVTAGQNTNAGTANFRENINLGGVSGTISPAGAASQIWLTSYALKDNIALTVVPDPTTGAFQFSKVPQGAYFVSFSPSGTYRTPITTVFVVSAGQQVNAGLFTFVQGSTPATSNLACKINGTSVSWISSATYASPALEIAGRRTEGSSLKTDFHLFNMNIKLDQVTAPGTYVISETSTSSFSYSASGMFSGAGSWTTRMPGGSATIIVKTIDESTKTISGSFNAVLIRTSGFTGNNRVISDGTFAITYK